MAAISVLPERALLVGSFWEKLAGASLALSALLHVCELSGLSLVEPRVRASVLLPPRLPGEAADGSLPLSTYYDLPPLRRALAPQQLLNVSAWQRISTSAAPSERAAVLLIWRDSPADCRAALPQRAGLVSCPASCVARARREHHKFFDALTRGWPLSCLEASILRRVLRRRSLPLLRRYKAVTLLNWRRHDDGAPMLPKLAALPLRSKALVPARPIRGAVQAFLAQHGLLHSGYHAVQLRSHHLANELWLQHGTREGAAAQPRSSECSEALLRCAYRLSTLAHKAAPPERTIVASDLASLFTANQNQDGLSHRRKPYMRRCLLPAAPPLLDWYAASGLSFNCSALLHALINAPADTDAERSHALVASGAVARGRGSSAAGSAGAQCDAGVLGIADLILASQADGLVALMVRRPWQSAYLEWILQRRREAERPSTLVACRPGGQLVELRNRSASRPILSRARPG